MENSPLGLPSAGLQSLGLLTWECTIPHFVYSTHWTVPHLVYIDGKNSQNCEFTVCFNYFMRKLFDVGLIKHCTHKQL